MKKILSIDGNGQDLEALLKLLRGRGYAVREVTDEPPEVGDASRQSENRYRDIFENAPVGVFRSTLDGKFISANPALARMLKFDSPEELIRLVNRTNIVETIYADPTHRREVLASVLQHNDWQIFEERICCKDGSIITCNFHYRAVPGQGDSPREFEGFVEDISERKRAEQEVQRANDLLRAIIHAAPTAIIGLDLDGNVQHVWNPAAEKMLGWSAQEVMGRPLPSVPAESGEEFRQFRDWIRSGKVMNGVEVCRQKRDGTPIEYSICASPLHDSEGRITGNIAVLVDIADRKRAEETLRESENRYRLIVETAEEGIWQLDREWKTTYVNRRMEQMLGCEPGSMLGLNLCDFMDDEGRRAVAELISHREQGIRETHDFRFVRRDGSRLDALVSASPQVDERGEFVGSFAMVTDITDRKRTESVISARMRLLEFAATHTLDELLEATLNEVAALTDSCIGFYHYLEADQKTLSLQNWSTRTKSEFCKAEGKGLHYDVSAAGVWVDCIRERRPVIHNDYVSLPHRKGLPPGHAPVIRELVVPVFRGERIVAVLGVGNKPRSYTPQDVETVSLLADLAWGIADRKRAEEALRVSERKYRTIIEHAPFGICRSTREGKLVGANPAVAGILKYDSPEELLEAVNRSSIQDVLFAEPSQRGPLVDRIFEGNSWQVFVNRYRCKDGSVITCKVHSRRILGQKDSEHEFESFLENITERLEAEKALCESEEKFRVLAETSPTAIFLYQGEMIVYANPATERLFGYSSDELLRMSFWDWAHDDFKEMVRERGRARLRGEAVPDQYESRFVTKAGEDRWLVVSAGLIDYHGRPTGVASFLDITDIKQAEERIRASLMEKEVLLKEVHHRVKNNLQIISSLLYLQEDYLGDEQARALFRDSQNRIRSMALIHQKLYQSECFAFIDLREYLEDLANCLFSNGVKDSAMIEVNVDAGEVSLSMDEAIPCGLIVNELLSNSLKHAFPDGRGGEVTVRCRIEDGWIALTVSDNGVGLPPDLDFRNTETLGLQLVTMLVSQLHGTIELNNDHGACFTMRFKGARLE